MTVLFALATLAAFAASAPLNDAEEVAKKLLHAQSPDTVENRKMVKEILQAMNIRTRTLGRVGTSRSRVTTTPSPMPDLGPKNNLTLSHIAENNQEMAEWMYQGDILLTPEQARMLVTGDTSEVETSEGDSKRTKRACSLTSSGYWSTKSPIYYTLDSSLPSSTVSLIRQGIQFWGDNTCLSFRENSNGMNRLRFYRGNGCWSYIGKQPTWTSQDISIGSGCETLGTVTHEIGHALGFYHTQSRYDRDNWISVDFSNIPTDLQYNFEKQTPATETHFGQQYDYGSVMQYGPYAFAADPNRYTIRARYSEHQNSMGQREAPAFSDVRMMNWLYNCSMNCVNTAIPPCRQPGYQDPQNCNRCKCPRMFSGTYCERLPSGSAAGCNGGVLQATTSSWSTLKGTAGNPNDWSTKSTPTDCYWHITAPAGRRIQVRLSTPPKNCMEQCPWQAVELNLGQFDMYGIIMCCQSATQQTYTSVSNMVAIRGIVRYNQLAFGLDYRLV